MVADFTGHQGHTIREAGALRGAIATGAELRDQRGRRVVPLGPSFRKLLDTLAAILDDAIGDGHQFGLSESAMQLDDRS